MEKKKKMLETKRLVLKAFEERDRQQVVSILFDEDIKKTYMIPDFEDRKQAEALFEKMMVYSRAEDHFVYGIYWNDVLIGIVNDCEIENFVIEIGYVIMPAYQGKGFATEAVGACIDELFRMGFQLVKAGCFEENMASGRVMQKCGMKKMDFEEDIEYRGALHHCLYYGIEKA